MGRLKLRSRVHLTYWRVFNRRAYKEFHYWTAKGLHRVYAFKQVRDMVNKGWR